MAKGQKRSGREPKKPKKDKLAKSAPVSGSPLAAARTAQKPAK
jgi:hypothetical protein